MMMMTGRELDVAVIVGERKRETDQSDIAYVIGVRFFLVILHR